MLSFAALRLCVETLLLLGRALDFLDRVLEVVHAFEAAVDRREADVGDLVELAQLAHHHLPDAARLAEAGDVFVERGAFDSTQARRYLVACREAGLALRLHADQFTEAGGVPLAVDLAVRSVDHLEATGPEGVRELAASEVAAVLLPVAALCLGRPMPPARALVDAGAIVALATDFNPGSAFCESLPVVMSLACTQLALAPAEALAACTVNAAYVLGRADTLGRIAPGYAADLVLLDVPDWRYLAYHLGGEHVALVIKEGQVVWER